jgi:hypothetical protein
MVLSRSLFTNPYGNFRKLMEGRSDHGGYGNVTWNVGPHAEHKPYGDDHNIAFVSRDKILSGAQHAHNTSEMEKHANDIGNQMDSGATVHIPKIKFKGGKPVIDARQHGAIHAAGQRGAEKIPVAYHRKDNFSLMLHVGDMEHPGAPRTGQERDPNVRYRWNGNGWYTKPSFNNGKCQGGAIANIPSDKCIIGGGSPPASAQLPAAPAAAPKKQVNKLEPFTPWDGKQLEPLKFKIDRSKVNGRQPYDMHPVGQGFNREILRNRMDGSLSGYSGVQPKMTYTDDQIDIPDDKSDNIKVQLKKLNLAREEMKEKGYIMGKFLGAGAAGAVFEGPDDPDGMPTVFKFDNGPYEARMADLVMSAGLSGNNAKNPVSILPRYISTHLTKQNMTRLELPLFAIHREDLANTKDHMTSDEASFLGGFGGEVAGISHQANWGTYTREKALSELDEIIKRNHQRVEEINNRSQNSKLGQEWPKIVEGMRTLMKHGILPCDIHSDNWGIRESTGEIVMRDVGCATFIDD